MAQLTSKNVTQLNKMNRAAQNSALGTRMGIVQVSGSYTVVLNDASASKVEIATGYTGLQGYLVQAFTSGSHMTGTKVILSASGSNIVITAGSLATSTPKSLGVGDTIQYVAW